MRPTCRPACGARYVGIDNHGAGVTAAYLVDQWLGSAPSGVLITLSRTVFRGEGEREVGFRSALRGSGREVVEISDSDGIDETTERLVLDALKRHPGIEAVYSPGGGNTATVAAFEKIGRVCRVFVAHDLDADNRRLLRDGQDLGRPAQRPARRRAAGDAADPATSRRLACGARAPGADPGDHALQPARLIVRVVDLQRSQIPFRLTATPTRRLRSGDSSGAATSSTV